MREKNALENVNLPYRLSALPIVAKATSQNNYYQ